MLDSTLSGFLFLVSILLLWRRVQSSRPSSSSKSVVIVVLGDIGRSPRMLYHAQSFVSHGYTTQIVAYRGSTPPKELLDNRCAHFVYLPQPLAFVSRLPRPLFLLLSPLKVVLAAFSLLYTLAVRIERAPSFMLVQNPPAIPTLPIVKFAALLRGSKVIIDWHNTGYSILALRLGGKSLVVRFAKWVELSWGRDAYAHLCVTDAMRTGLLTEAKLRGRAVVFHDRPPSHFRRQTPSEASSLFARLPVLQDPSLASFLPTPSATTFSSKTPSKTPRTALLVSATSWTPDEDFSLLLRALTLYNTSATLSHSSESPERLPKILMLITGKGADKAAFEREVERLENGWEWVRVRTAWLESEDYPRLLGSADLGISLHASTSGVDLPMKVVDMFGCSLPVCALEFPCISELIKEGINGRTFRTAAQLSALLIELLGELERFPSPLDILAAGIKDARYEEGRKWCSWEENWDQVVLPLVVP